MDQAIALRAQIRTKAALTGGKRADALDYVEGYTVANDYAIRDYLENYYRPNLRVKNRDTCTVIGPWLVDAADVPDPHGERSTSPSANTVTLRWRGPSGVSSSTS